MIPGFLTDQAILDTIWEVEWDIGRGTVLGVFERLKECFPREWVEILDSSVCVGDVGTLPDLKVGIGESSRALSSARVKDIYWALLAGKVRVPASEKVWRCVFPGLDIEC